MIQAAPAKRKKPAAVAGTAVAGTAVAETVDAPAFPYHDGSDDHAGSDDEHSIPGDVSVDPSDFPAGPSLPGDDGSTQLIRAVLAHQAHSERCAPKESAVGDVSGLLPQWRGHAKHNREAEVGNFGLFLGNWGSRAAAAHGQTLNHDRQILKCPGQVIVLCETTAAVAQLLQQPQAAVAVATGTDSQSRLNERKTFEHWVVRGDEVDSALLIAARKDTTNGVLLLDHDVYGDHAYTDKGKTKMATSRTLICEIGFKQNIGHLGTQIVVMGVHGHYRTMKVEWQAAWVAFWDRLASKIKQYEVQFLAGDLNMSFTEVVKQLGKRGIQIDCIAWYPWLHADEKCKDQSLGFDSCGIFYIGGQVQVSMPWSLAQLDVLTAVADEFQEKYRLHLIHNDQQPPPLDTYPGTNVPGQHWKCYRSKGTTAKETIRDKCLEDRLVELLKSTSTLAELQTIPRREGVDLCPYLRFKQKKMDKSEWLLNNKMHNGAHFPLCVFTNNSRARSQVASAKRALKKRKCKGYGKDYGKGRSRGRKGKAAVAGGAKEYAASDDSHDSDDSANADLQRPPLRGSTNSQGQVKPEINY